MYRIPISVTGYQLDKNGKPVLADKNGNPDKNGFPIPSGSRSYNFFLAQDEACHLVSVSPFPYPYCTAPMLSSGSGQKEYTNSYHRWR